MENIETPAENTEGLEIAGWIAVVLLVLVLVGLFNGMHPSSSIPPNDYHALARQDATDAGIDTDLFERQIQQESGFNPRALSPAGAEGIAQFMPATAAGLGIDPWNPDQSLQAAAQLMAAYVTRYGDYSKALSSYNCGPTCTNDAISQCGNNWEQCIPIETRVYIAAIMR
jgi:soluble lytic murein transglycosylase-like protein